MPSTSRECVKVVVRVRPRNGQEVQASEAEVVKVSNGDLPQIAVQRKSKSETWQTFAFDHVYGSDATQEQIFRESALPIVDSVVSGYNGTIFAYGQTGTGKTHTMEGKLTDEVLRGIIPRTFHHVFERISGESGQTNFLVRASFLEIYNDEVHDLLNKQLRKKLDVKEGEGGFFVPELTTYGVKSAKEMLKILHKGQKTRSTGATKMNPGSSRSHSIFSVVVESSIKDENGEFHYKVGKLNLVDLAGSEKQKKTGAEGARLQEAMNINLSLSALGNVIKALVNPKAKHVPFRDSKLTRLLQNSLGGNAKTVMIANVGPAQSNLEETLGTLRYANRAKNIRNKPVINEDPKDALLRKMQEEIDRLKSEFEKRNGGAGAGQAAPSVQERVVEKIVVEHDGLRPEEFEKNRQEMEKEKTRLQKEHDAVKETALHSKTEAETKAANVERELAEKLKLLDEEAAQLSDLQTSIERKSEQLIKGGEAVEMAERQKQELERAKLELRERDLHRRILKQNIEEAAEAQQTINRKFENRQEELQVKNERLSELRSRLARKQEEFQELQEENEADREELTDDIRELTRSLKLKTILLEHFIPTRYLALIEAHSHRDPHTDEWSIDGIEFAGNHANAHQLSDSALGGATGHTRQREPSRAITRAILQQHPELSPNGDLMRNMPMEYAHELRGMRSRGGDDQDVAALHRAIESALERDVDSQIPDENIYFSYGVKVKNKRRSRKGHKASHAKSKGDARDANGDAGTSRKDGKSHRRRHRKARE